MACVLRRGAAQLTTVAVAMAPRRWGWIGLVGLCVLVHVRTLGYGLFLDDHWLVRRWSGDEVLGAFVDQFDPSGLNPAYYRPLGPVSWAIDWSIWGSNTLGSHVTNLVLHTAAVLLLYRLLGYLGLRWWAAFVAAAYFAVVPSNVATVVYVAHRTDAMAAICIVAGLLCVRRYEIERQTRWLVGLAVAFVLAVLSKEIGLALVPMTFVWWWYLRVEARDDHDAAPTVVSVIDHWKAEALRWWQALVDRSERRGWLVVVGPLLAMAVGYLVYRSAVLPAGALTGRFGESQSPPRAVVAGVYGTVKGVPWELRGWTLGPLVVLCVCVFALAPRSRGWRVVVLGAGLILAGIAPLVYSGGVEPRLLYVAQVGMAVALAGVLSALGDGLAVGTAAGPASEGRTRVLAVGAVVGVITFVLVTVALTIRAQDEFAAGSAKQRQADLAVLALPGIADHVAAPRLDEIRERLGEEGAAIP